MIKQQMAQVSAMVEKRLAELFKSDMPELLRQSMYYSISAGGKRLRPYLNIKACELFSQDYTQTLDIACAIEMIHTYSLIHDDLPALDNDDLRRGRSTNHVVYGQAQAILAGDGLLSFAFETMLQNALKYQSNLDRHVCAIDFVASGCGVNGMVGGQVVDVASDGQQIDEQTLGYIHQHKTADLIVCAVKAGAAIGGATDAQLGAMQAYAQNLGLAFQIIDDILDVVSTDEQMGKSVGKDVRDQKQTYVSMYGLKEAKSRAEHLTAQAKAALESFGSKAEQLSALADYMLARTY